MEIRSALTAGSRKEKLSTCGRKMQEKLNKRQVLTRGGCAAIGTEGKRVQQEKSHRTGTEQLIPLTFVCHLTSTGRFLLDAVLSQSWREGLDTAPSPGCYFYPLQKISGLERTSNGKKVARSFDFRKDSQLLFAFRCNQQALSSFYSPVQLYGAGENTQNTVKDTKILLCCFVWLFCFNRMNHV